MPRTKLLFIVAVVWRCCYGLPSFSLPHERTCPPLSVSPYCIPSVQNGHHHDPSWLPYSLNAGQCSQGSLFHLSPYPFPAGQSVTAQTPSWIPHPLSGAWKGLDQAATESKGATGAPSPRAQCPLAHLLSGETQGDLEDDLVRNHGHPVIARHGHMVCPPLLWHHTLFLSPLPLGHSLGSPCPESCDHCGCCHIDLCGHLSHPCWPQRNTEGMV